ncbi:helix-turn-helix domain-containing protein [Kitasatospora sp. NPDC094011]|uniref:helix-turn-helix domain-containing protein n=1 Tax=Kitasatospora sp. NPDC094011 TaxID=3364090 RepID=UPI0037F12C44
MAEQQQEHPAARKPPSAAENFAGRLRTLRLDAGQPSFRTMAKIAGSISHTTLYEAASGTRFPSWPTTRAFVRACGGDEREWHDRWCAALSGEPPTDPVVPAPPAAPAPPPVEPPPPVRPTLARRWTHAVSLLLGLVLGIIGTLALLAVRASAAPDAPPPGDHPTQGPADPGASPPSWVARPVSAQQAASGTDFTLPVRTPVARGDTLVVSILLTGACPHDR